MSSRLKILRSVTRATELAIAATEVVVPYPRFAQILKMLTLVIFAYVVGAFVASPDWRAALTGTFTPTLSFDRTTLGTIVAILGTTISPYMFFWQASEGVEEEIALQLATGDAGPPQLPAGFLQRLRIDTALGLVPEISANRLMVSIRMMQADAQGKLQQISSDAAFELSLCA